MKIFYAVFLILFFGAQICIAQTIEPKNVDFKINKKRLSLPTLGGIRAPQISNIDLDRDGTLDLVLFDRDGGVVTPLVWTGSQYKYAPEYASIFPPARSWMLLRDYDKDGIMDVFCSPTKANIPGVEVWKGNVVNGKLSFARLLFPDKDFDVLYVPIGSSSPQVYVAPIDLPAIRDVDKDGDLDILAFEPGGSTVYFYKNVSIENGKPLSELQFGLGDICYGKFVESGFSEIVDLSTNSVECANKNGVEDNVQIRHSGSTIASIDLRDNGLQDLLLGDVSYTGIVHLKNGGTLDSAWMTDQVTHWPYNDDEAVNLKIFNSVFDVQYGTDSVILVTTNDPFSGQWDDHIWMYQRDSADRYRLISKNAIIDEMIHLGKNSAPAFIDENGDGLIDIVVGSNGLLESDGTYSPRLFLFQNVGTPKHPAYELVDDDWLSFSQYKGTSDWFAPGFGDIDNDGDIDLIIGDNEGYLYHVDNKSSDSASFKWGSPVYKAFDIKVSGWAVPHIFDWNGDGHSDLLIGEQNFNSFQGRLGSFNYYENKTTDATGVVFDPEVNNTPNSPTFGGVFMRDKNSVNNYSAAATYHDGISTVLLTANDGGSINIYEAINKYTNANDTFELQKKWDRSSFYAGRRVIPSLADIDRDSKLEMVVGNSRGGLVIYDTDLAALDVKDAVVDTERPERQLSISPNPATSFITVRTSLNQPKVISIYNSIGEIVLHTAYSPEPINVSTLSTGHYVVKVSNATTSESYQLVKIK